MKVYCVMKLVDDEYGGREILNVWATNKQAEAHIAELGQEVVHCWYDDEDLYTIEEYPLLGI